MTKPTWLIQTNMDGVDTFPMIMEVTSQGMHAIPIESQLGAQIDFSQYGTENDCVICYGDIDFVRQVTREAPWIPGSWCNFRNMKCSTYYAYFGEHLLNKYYIMLPAGDLLVKWSEFIGALYPMASVHGNKSLFIRPDSGAKPFTGYVVRHGDKDKIQTLVEAVGPETLLVIAPERMITKEFRFVICDKNVVAGSMYLPTELSITSDDSPSSFRLAQTIASQDWQPDLCYTVDIAEFDGAMYLLEINSFSCAGFYDCDIESIVRNASKVAVAEWEDYYV